MRYDIKMEIFMESDGFRVVCNFCNAIMYASMENWDQKNNTPKGQLLGYLIFSHKCFKREI